MRRCNQAGIDLIKRFEGLRLTSYLCPGDVWTVGWGHTQGVKPGMTISLEVAEGLLDQDLLNFESGVEQLCSSSTLNQFSALVSFSFNVGLKALQRSTLRRKLSRGDVHGAANEFLLWTRAKGQQLEGLRLRRIAERELFLTPDKAEGVT